MINTSWVIAILSVIIWVLLFWNLMLRTKITELHKELQKRRDWTQRELDGNRRI